MKVKLCSEPSSYTYMRIERSREVEKGKNEEQRGFGKLRVLINSSFQLPFALELYFCQIFAFYAGETKIRNGLLIFLLRIVVM